MLMLWNLQSSHMWLDATPGIQDENESKPKFEPTMIHLDATSYSNPSTMFVFEVMNR